MKKTLPKTYNPQKYENEIYRHWEESGAFNPDNIKSQKSYVNILPPPNANGELHIGHASGYAVIDLLGRYHRMLGEKVLLLPGKDHAGIQSQVVYEKKIQKERKVSRHSLGREKFYKEIYDFCMDRSQYMRNQEKKLGLTADWSREKFTLDPQIVKTVLKTFIKMYNEVDKNGKRMAYRGERIINWCPRCATALADIETEHIEQKTTLYTFKYSADFPFSISTTRPETKLGDTAVAVNPKDKRYKQYIGKTFTVNFLGQKLTLKIIADKNVAKNFGTGALGVTPAHSLIDWEMAQKNKLPTVKVINEKAKIRTGFGKFSGLSVDVARKKIIHQLREEGLMKDEKEIMHNLSVCERCKSTIEPLPSTQWFIDIDHANFSLKKEAHKAIAQGRIKIHPEKFKKIMLNWIDNVHDWCISRQIWWGPRIPVWYKNEKIKCQIKSPGKNWRQDEDTFDTWFSSGQWAYTALGFPNNKDYKNFYPSSNMIMGRDILPFWAFRMIILSLYRTLTPPFKNLYFTGLVRDEHGQKMSKSRGNGIEPLAMIKKYGTDAVRLSLLIGSTPGNDTNLGEAKIEGFRNMINKLWNIARYGLNLIDEINETKPKKISQINEKKFTLSDYWIIDKTKKLIQNVNTDFKYYRFSSAGEQLRDFTWNDLADWYLEASKFENNKKEKGIILNQILNDILKLWHPFIPFVTETIWSNLSKNLLLTEKWPIKENYPRLDTKKATFFEEIQSLIMTIRNLRAENKIEPAKKIRVIIYAHAKMPILVKQSALIKNLRTGIKELVIKKNGPEIKQALFESINEIEVYIPLKGIVDFEKEKTRIKKELINYQNFSKQLKNKLANKKFIKNAPEEIIIKEKKKLKATIQNIKKLKTYLKNLA